MSVHLIQIKRKKSSQIYPVHIQNVSYALKYSLIYFSMYISYYVDNFVRLHLVKLHLLLWKEQWSKYQ